jgi:predicted DNA-binding WGR domain protein
MQHTDECTDYTLQILVLERRDESCNMARYYVLSVEPTLFGDVALVREWGRIGSPGRRRLDLHADDEAAGEALETWLARKVGRGYQVRPDQRPPVSGHGAIDYGLIRDTIDRRLASTGQPGHRIHDVGGKR